MNLYEAIFIRKSVRSYVNDPVSPQVLEKLRRHFQELNGLFGNFETDYAVLDNRKGQQKMLSMFSVKAPYYMAFYSEEGPRYLMNMGYLMEQMVLYMCSLGLGTCFIGSRSVHKDQQSKGDLKLVGIVAFGRSKGMPTRRASEADRLPMDELCVYKEVTRQWIRQLLEAARLAPSTMNAQPWRFVVYDNRIHVFSKKHMAEKMNKWEEINFGIMFANLMVASEELWLDVDLIKLENISQKNFPNNQYILSAVMKS